jgi:hypothetical protein
MFFWMNCDDYSQAMRTIGKIETMRSRIHHIGVGTVFLKTTDISKVLYMLHR